MSEFTADTPQSSQSEPVSLAEFQARYADPDQPLIEHFEGQEIHYSTVHFHGQIDERVIVLRAGIHRAPATEHERAKVQQIFWLGAFDLSKNQTVLYEVADSERQAVNPLLQRQGRYEMLHTAKSRERGELIQFRMGSHVLEWVQFNTYE